MKLFYEEELRRKSYYEMYQIAIEEKLVDVHLETPERGAYYTFDEISGSEG